MLRNHHFTLPAYPAVWRAPEAIDKGLVFPQQINLPLFNPALNPADNDQFTQMSFFHRQFVN